MQWVWRYGLEGGAKCVEFKAYDVILFLGHDPYLATCFAISRLMQCIYAKTTDIQATLDNADKSKS